MATVRMYLTFMLRAKYRGESKVFGEATERQTQSVCRSWEVADGRLPERACFPLPVSQ